MVYVINLDVRLKLAYNACSVFWDFYRVLEGHDNHLKVKITASIKSLDKNLSLVVIKITGTIIMVVLYQRHIIYISYHKHNLTEINQSK